MKKIKLLAILGLAIALCGCGNNDMKSLTMTDYRDPDTGVHYWKYSTGRGAGVTVRYNSDGTIMVD